MWSHVTRSYFELLDIENRTAECVLKFEDQSRMNSPGVVIDVHSAKIGIHLKISSAFLDLLSILVFSRMIIITAHGTRLNQIPHSVY
jgi:hypothetical protein